MKLAESWVEDAPARTALAGFHDEVEEHDEVDEAEDGCGGVVWQRYVLKKPHTSNKVLHELAREVRGVEKRRGKKLTSIQYKTFMIVGKLLRTHFCDRDTIILLNCWLSWIA